MLQDRAVLPRAQGGVLQRAGSHGLQLLEGIVKAALEVRVGDDQDAFLVPRHQADLLRNSRVQLGEQTKAFKTREISRYQNKPTYFVETGNDVAEVDPGRPRFRHLVEEVIPEELQQVAVSCLRPCRVLLEPDPGSAKVSRATAKRRIPVTAGK